MPNLDQEFRVEVGFLWGGAKKNPPPSSRNQNSKLPSGR